MPSSRKHAVVLGASMGGLLAARVLADHFERVTVLDRDVMPPIGEHRRGVPQGRHIHLLLARGGEILEQLLPGLTAEVVADGGLTGALEQFRLMIGGHRLRTFADERRSLSATRPLLEGHVRRRVMALPNVVLREGCDVLAPVASGNGRVSGVRVRGADGSGEVLPGDLVVDATGRGSRSPRWLEELGYSAPQEERVGVDIRYMTRFYTRSPGQVGGDLVVFIGNAPPGTRGAGAFAVEGDRWLVTLADYFGQPLPTDDEGFRAFAQALPFPDLAELLAGSEPCSEAVPASYPASQRRRYERLKRFPGGYLVFGDAVCSFNPIYGQGMSVCALEALALDEALRGDPGDPAARFFRAAARVIDTPWSIAVGGDLQLERVEGRRTPMTRFLNWYMERVMAVAEHDVAVSNALLTVMNLQGPPEQLMAPGTMARVARGRLRPPRERATESARPPAGSSRAR